MIDPELVLSFWFASGREQAWFERNEAFDTAVEHDLGPAFEAAAAGQLAHWQTSARGSLALCILLDQVPRNIFRGDPRAFETDAQARQVTKHAITSGFDRELSQVERCFLYMPLEHSEDLGDQEESCRLMAELDERPDWHDYALRHRDIVARFGRFPHRNAVLGRDSSAEELTFLEGPDSSF